MYTYSPLPSGALPVAHGPSSDSVPSERFQNSYASGWDSFSASGGNDAGTTTPLYSC